MNAKRGLFFKAVFVRPILFSQILQFDGIGGVGGTFTGMHGFVQAPAAETHEDKPYTVVGVMAGGGVASNYDPLDVTQYTVAELRAAVEAAENWGTYVTVHAYTPRAVRQAGSRRSEVRRRIRLKPAKGERNVRVFQRVQKTSLGR